MLRFDNRILLRLVMLLLTLAGCSTPPDRTPAQATEIKYVFKPLMSCQPEHRFSRNRLSALTGFMVGPNVIKHVGTTASKILRPFSSDGCSLSPDGLPIPGKDQAWVQCCVVHDTHYWMGGTEEQRALADTQLGQCIAKIGFADIGRGFANSVKFFGAPRTSQSYRWGFGWNYKRPYKDLDARELEQVVGLYGTQKEEQLRLFQTQPILLDETCSSLDLAANGFTKDELRIFRFLGAKLKQNDLIEWAKLGYYNFRTNHYEVKLSSCPQPITLHVSKRAPYKIELFEDCQIFR